MGEEMRQALEDAVDLVEDENPDPVEPPTEDPPAEPPVEPPAEPPAEGEPSEDPTEVPPEGEPPVEPPADDGEPLDDPPPPDKVAEKLAKAPVNWNPAARESWKDLPEEVRQQIHKRETEMNRAHMAGSENRKTGEDFNALAGRYSSVIAAEGIGSPLEGFERVLQTMATLRMGSVEQKAQQIAGFIKAYNIDITTLDDLLVGKAPGSGNGGQPPGNPQLEQMLNERLQPMDDLLNRINTADANNAANIEANAATDVNTFGDGKEFFGDVRYDMGDLMDMAAQRSQHMTLDQAYEKACALNPEVSQIMKTRATQNSLPAKRRAASSIHGKKSGSGAGLEELSMRATIESLYDNPQS